MNIVIFSYCFYSISIRELLIDFDASSLVRIFAENKNTVMKLSLVSTVARLLRETADKLDAGNSELSESEAMDIMSILCHQVMSKASACEYLNLGRSRFDEKVRSHELPKGRKRVGFKELVWYKDELDACVKKLKK